MGQEIGHRPIIGIANLDARESAGLQEVLQRIRMHRPHVREVAQVAAEEREPAGGVDRFEHDRRAAPEFVRRGFEQPHQVCRFEVFDDLRAKLLADRSQLFTDLSAPFFGANRPGSNVSRGVRDQFWLMSLQVGRRRADLTGGTPR